MYRLYYDTLPGDRVDSKFLHNNIQRFKQSIWIRSGSIHHFLSFLGIEYTWTNNINDPDAIVVIEIDSADTEDALDIIKHASQTYTKSIVVSTTEPSVNIHVDVLADLYPNVIYLSAGDYTLNSSLENVLLFPFFLVRPQTLLTMVHIHHLEMCNFLTSKKQYVFNHLSNYWAPNKYHAHHTIKKYFNQSPSNKALISYKPIDYPGNKSIARTSSNLLILDMMKSWISYINTKGNFAELYPAEEYINYADPAHPDHYRIERIKGDSHFHFDMLQHPVTVYKDSYLSLVTEVIKGRLHYSNGKNVSYHFISEKSMQPILNGHLFVVNAPDKFHTAYLRDTLGFELYDEVFDYNRIEDTYVHECDGASEYLTAYNIINQLNNFNPECIFNNASLLAEKLHYNRNLLTNPYSKLRLKLRQEFINILERYRDLNK